MAKSFRSETPPINLDRGRKELPGAVVDFTSCEYTSEAQRRLVGVLGSKGLDPAQVMLRPLSVKQIRDAALQQRLRKFGFIQDEDKTGGFSGFRTDDLDSIEVQLETGTWGGIAVYSASALEPAANGVYVFRDGVRSAESILLIVEVRDRREERGMGSNDH